MPLYTTLAGLEDKRSYAASLLALGFRWSVVLITPSSASSCAATGYATDHRCLNAMRHATLMSDTACVREATAGCGGWPFG